MPQGPPRSVLIAVHFPAGYPVLEGARCIWGQGEEEAVLPGAEEAIQGSEIDSMDFKGGGRDGTYLVGALEHKAP